MKENIYVISTGRSGSTFISNFFNKNYPDLEIGHQAYGSRVINIISNLPLKGELYIKFLKLLFKVFHRAEGELVFSTADPLLSMAISKIALHQNLNGKYIHLVRRPESYINSFMNWKKKYTKWVLHHIIPFWNPVPFILSSDISFMRWVGLKKSLNFAWVWGYKNELFSKLRIKYPNNYLVLRLEDITSVDLDVRNSALLKLSDFLGNIEYKEDLNNRNFSFVNKVNASKRTNVSPTDYWSEKDKLFFSKYCQPIVEKFGY